MPKNKEEIIPAVEVAEAAGAVDFLQVAKVLLIPNLPPMPHASAATRGEIAKAVSPTGSGNSGRYAARMRVSK